MAAHNVDDILYFGTTSFLVISDVLNYSFWIPLYSFWHFDDFSWGNTRVVVGEGKKTLYVADAEPVRYLRT